ncbi:hypothetical protein ACH42_15730 [Endozoicomonas sp. (ex Bugula neritina AB1)]|nr:hypothetical protein ACH42_15730 [Endozoicomonas sp. (ex Bugula neritina AB1)]
MSHHHNQEPFTPWHKEPWAWYIVAVLLVTFCWGGVQLYTAFTYQDSVVIADYYKEGKSINLDMTRLKEARQLGIKVELSIDDLIGEVRVHVQGDVKKWPDQLKLSFLSPVFEDQDRFIDLRRSVSGAYVGQIDEAIAGRYYLQLETLDKQVPEKGYQSGWKISTEAIIQPGKPINLNASEAS